MQGARLLGDGFLEFSRGSFVIDLLAASMLLVVLLQTASVLTVKIYRNYRIHKYLQIATSVAVLIMIVIFEVEVRTQGWRHLAEESPYYDTWLTPVLVFHICCALVTILIWTVVLGSALKKFPHPPKPAAHSARHKTQARLALFSLTATVVTGWFFFFIAFVATP